MITDQRQLCTCYVIAKIMRFGKLSLIKWATNWDLFWKFDCPIRIHSVPSLHSFKCCFFYFTLGATNFKCCLIAVSITIRGRWRIWLWHSLSLWMLGGASHAGMSLHSRWLYEWKMSNNLVLLFSEQHFNCTFVHTWYSLYPRIQLRLGFFPVRTFQTLTMDSKRIIKIVNIKMISVDSPWNQLS